MKKYFYLLSSLCLALVNIPTLQASTQSPNTSYTLFTTATICLASSFAQSTKQEKKAVATLQCIQKQGKPYAKLLQQIAPDHTIQAELPLYFDKNWTIKKLQKISIQNQHYYIHLLTNQANQPQACYIGPSGLRGGGNEQSSSSQRRSPREKSTSSTSTSSKSTRGKSTSSKTTSSKSKRSASTSSINYNLSNPSKLIEKLQKEAESTSQSNILHDAFKDTFRSKDKSPSPKFTFSAPDDFLSYTEKESHSSHTSSKTSSSTTKASTSSKSTSSNKSSSSTKSSVSRKTTTPQRRSSREKSPRDTWHKIINDPEDHTQNEVAAVKDFLKSSSSQNTSSHNTLLSLLKEPSQNLSLAAPFVSSDLTPHLDQISLKSTDGKPFQIDLNDAEHISQQTDAFAKNYFQHRSKKQQNRSYLLSQFKDQEEKEDGTQLTEHDPAEKLISTAKNFLDKITPENKERYRKEGIERLKVLEKKRDLASNDQHTLVTASLPSLVGGPMIGGGGGPAAFAAAQKSTSLQSRLYEEIKKLRVLYRPGNTPEFQPSYEVLEGVQENFKQGGPTANVASVILDPKQALKKRKEEWEKDFEVDAIERAKRRHKRLGYQYACIAAPIESYIYGKQAVQSAKMVYQAGKVLKSVLTKNPTKAVSTKVNTNTKSAYQIAKEGGKHSKEYEKCINKRTIELTRGIRSYKKQITRHQNQIKDPKKWLPIYNKPDNWDKLNAKEKAGAIKKWYKDIQEFEEHINILEGILKQREQTKLQK
ncbi:MAG: hypothetical protein AAF380_02720 [Bacteroidota bacterium]